MLHARAGLLGTVILLNASILIIKAVRLRLMTAGRLSVSASILTKVAVAALNNLSPLRGGDIARLWMLERHAGMTRTSGLAVGVSELLVEVTTLCSLVALIAGALPGQRWALIAALVVLGPAVALLDRASEGSFGASGRSATPAESEDRRGHRSAVERRVAD